MRSFSLNPEHPSLGENRGGGVGASGGNVLKKPDFLRQIRLAKTKKGESVCTCVNGD